MHIISAHSNLLENIEFFSFSENENPWSFNGYDVMFRPTYTIDEVQELKSNLTLVSLYLETPLSTLEKQKTHYISTLRISENFDKYESRMVGLSLKLLIRPFIRKTSEEVKDIASDISLLSTMVDYMDYARKEYFNPEFVDAFYDCRRSLVQVREDCYTLLDTRQEIKNICGKYWDVSEY